MHNGAWIVSMVAAAGLWAASPASGQQQKATEPDLSKLAQGQGLRVFNRSGAELRRGGVSRR